MPSIESVEKATTGTAAGFATDAAATTDWAKTGPRISSAPSAIAVVAAARAPSGVPRSSLTRICRLEFGNSRSARSAAFRMSLASCAALPVADNGRSIAILTVPVPSTSPATGTERLVHGRDVERRAGGEEQDRDRRDRPGLGGASQDCIAEQMILPGSPKTR